MANPNSPFGFRPVGHLIGGAYNGATRQFQIPSSDTGSYFIGDVVDLAGSADATFGEPTIAIATAGSVNVGVVIGFDPVLGGLTPNLNITYRPASTAMYATVSVDPFAIYEVMASSTISAADIGLNISLTAGAGGNTSTGYSSFQVDTTTKAVTSTLQWHLLSLARPGTNNAFGAQAVVQVSPNLSRYFGSTAGT